MADREQPFGEGNARNLCTLSPAAYRPQVKKRQNRDEPNVRLRKELPDALAGHLHPAGGSATLNFPTDLGEPMAYCGYAKAIKQI